MPDCLSAWLWVSIVKNPDAPSKRWKEDRWLVDFIRCANIQVLLARSTTACVHKFGGCGYDDGAHILVYTCTPLTIHDHYHISILTRTRTYHVQASIYHGTHIKPTPLYVCMRAHGYKPIQARDIPYTHQHTTHINIPNTYWLTHDMS